MNRYPLGDWQYEVQNGDTRLGYDDWVAHKIESDTDVVEAPKGLFPTTAYIITSRRKSGPKLTKSYGQYDEGSGLGPDLPNDSHLCLYETREQAERAFAEIKDPEFWMVLEVVVCSEEYLNA